MNLSAIYSNYDYEITFYPGNSFIWQSSLSNLNLKVDLDYYANERHNIKFGVGSIYYTFRPGNISPFGSESSVVKTNNPLKYALENYVYLQDDFKITDRLRPTR
jgi:hypothetical protein